VEIGNTDAEGRLCSRRLALADADKPDTLISFATLTGAARIALGPDLPPLFSTDDRLAESWWMRRAVSDPMWRLPFWSPYDAGLDSKVADVCNVTADGFAGAITAALFLKRFVAAPSVTHTSTFTAGRPNRRRPNPGRRTAMRQGGL